MIRPALWFLLFGAAFMSSALGDEAADRMLFNKYENLCSEARGGSEQKLLNCRTLKNQSSIAQKLVQKQVADICKTISRECQTASEGGYRNRLAYFSVTLSCTKHSDGCSMYEEETTVQKAIGDINLISETIEAIERTGSRVHPGLKLAVAAYVEAKDLGEDLQKSVRLVDSELRKYYQNAEIGCREDPQFADNPPPNECTAAIDHEWQMNSIRAVLSWQNENSVIRETTRQALIRWDIDRFKNLPKP